ncbi:MAG TPA: GGDEF domain-containing protein [Actinomycetes bacterium]
MRTRAWWAYLAAGTAAVPCYLALPRDWWQTAANLLVGLAAVAALLAGIWLHRPRRPALWGTLAAGLLFITGGDIVYALYDLVLHTATPFPSLADAAYLAGCPLIGLAMVLLVRARTAGKDRVAWIDAAIVASGFGLLSWVFLMEPTASSGDLSWVGRLVALAYPVWDVLFLALVVRLLAGVGARLPALRLLAGAVTLWLVYDTIYALLVQYGTYVQGSLVDAIWLLGYVLFGAAALHPSMAELTQPVAEPTTRLSWRRLVLLAGASLIAPVLLVSQSVLAGHRVDGIAIGAASMLLFLLVVLRIVGLVRQVEEQAEQLARLAQHDALTGIPNRRAWDGELPVAMDRARRDGVPLSVALLDLDHFKDFNDRFGHQAGDRLLKSATAAWAAALRATDRLCRYGGEEFAVLLPGATAEQAGEVLERLRAASPQEQTFSAGLVCWDGQEISDELVARADRALYAAKAAGRDRIVAAGGTPARAVTGDRQSELG